MNALSKTQERINANTVIRVLIRSGDTVIKSYAATVGRFVESARLKNMPDNLELAVDAAMQKLSEESGYKKYSFIVKREL